jgi:hypothetical protein
LYAAAGLAGFVLLARRRITGAAGPFDWRLPAYAGLWFAGWVLFCAVYVWQPWQTRLDLSWFVAAAPLAGLVLACLPVGRAVVWLLALGAMPFLLLNPLKPLVSTATPGVERFVVPRLPPALADRFALPDIFHRNRESLRFAAQPAAREPFEGMAALILARHCRDVGLLIGGNSWEYPLWVLNRFHRGGDARLTHYNYHAEIVALQWAKPPKPFPCAVVASKDGDRVPADSPLHGLYRKAMESPLYDLYLPD